MALIPGTLPSDTCYGTPQDLLELFAQYLSIPAADFQSDVVFSTSSTGLLSTQLWFDTTTASNPIMNIYVSGSWVDYLKNYIDNRTVATTPLGASDYIPVLQGGVVKKIAATNLPFPSLKLLQLQRTVVNTVVTVNAAIPADDTIPQNTEGVEVLVTASFTPVSASSTLYFKFSCHGRPTTSGGCIQMALFQDTTANALFAADGNYGVASNPLSAGFQFATSSVNTTARVYKVRVGTPINTVYLNGDQTGTRVYGGVQGTSLEIWEVA